MSEQERRIIDKRIESIHETVEDIRNILQGEKGICVRVSIIETKTESIQAELTEHKKVEEKKKSNNFRLMDILLAIGMFILGLMHLYLRR